MKSNPVNMIAVIANGEMVDADIVKKYTSDADLIIAADGGVATCLKAGIQPDYIVGDMDSIDMDPSLTFPQARIERISDQESTDLEKTIGFVRTFRPAEIRFFSILGLRTDHTMANMIILQNFSKDIRVSAYDNFGKLTLLHAGNNVLQIRKGRTVSFFTLNAVEKLTLSGFRYPLEGFSDPASFFGISNVCEDGECVVSFTSGSLLMYELFA